MSAPQFAGRMLARFLSKQREHTARPATCQQSDLRATLQKGDVLLVEGSSRISVAIQYLTQSTWSHAALYVGDALGDPPAGEQRRELVEADVTDGVRAVPLSEYECYHTRICRPVGLEPDEIDRIVQFVADRIGHQYDLRNVFDLARYLVQQPPVPQRMKRRLLAFGSGDPTRAICSSLIAQAFQSVRYPILPEVIGERLSDPAYKPIYNEILHIRHHTLFTPRDFDLSPYFRIVKPTIASDDFDPHLLTWV